MDQTPHSWTCSTTWDVILEEIRDHSSVLATWMNLRRYIQYICITFEFIINSDLVFSLALALALAIKNRAPNFLHT